MSHPNTQEYCEEQLGHHITLAMLHAGQGEPVQNVARHVQHGPASSTHHHQPRLQQPQTVDTIYIKGRYLDFPLFKVYRYYLKASPTPVLALEGVVHDAELADEGVEEDQLLVAGVGRSVLVIGGQLQVWNTFA